MSDKLAAAVLAAGRIDTKLREATGTEAKALIPVGGQPIIDRTLGALDGAEAVDEVRVVCAKDSPLLKHVGPRAIEAQGPGFIDTLMTGAEALGMPERLLVVTGDVPLVTSEGLDHFCRQALQCDAHIVYPVVRREESERVFPGGKRTFIRLREEEVTGGNVAVLSRDFLQHQGDRLSEAFAARKNPLRLCSMLGWGFVLRLLLGRLGIPEVAARAEKVLGSRVLVVYTPYPELGFDVDKPSHLASVEACLAQRST